MSLLTVLLGAYYGAGIAFGTTLTTTALLFSIRANQHITRLVESAPEDSMLE